MKWQNFQICRIVFWHKVHIELSLTFYFSWIYRENNTVKSELKKLQNEVESLSQQNHFLQEEVSLVLISLIVKKNSFNMVIFCLSVTAIEQVLKRGK